MIRKILIVFGTRPEAIKLVPIIKRLKSSPEFNVKICISAQHRDMLDSVLNSYNIVPDYDLSIMKDGQTLFYITSEILSRLEKILNVFIPMLHQFL